MNNKYIDNKVREFDQILKNNARQNGLIIELDMNGIIKLEQFIKDTIVQQQKEIIKDLQFAYDNSDSCSDCGNFELEAQINKLKSEQECRFDCEHCKFLTSQIGKCECVCHREYLSSRHRPLMCTHCQKPEEQL